MGCLGYTRNHNKQYNDCNEKSIYISNSHGKKLRDSHHFLRNIKFGNRIIVDIFIVITLF